MLWQRKSIKQEAIHLLLFEISDHICTIKPKEALMFRILTHSPASSRNQSQVNNLRNLSSCSVIRLGFEFIRFNLISSLVLFEFELFKID